VRYYFVFEKRRIRKMWVRPSISQRLLEGQFHKSYMRIPKNIFHFSNQFLCVKMDFSLLLVNVRV
jgi:hypothetical protein